jgi:hypothetical protein
VFENSLKKGQKSSFFFGFFLEKKCLAFMSRKKPKKEQNSKI